MIKTNGEKQIITEEQLDFLKEIMTIGAGNAAAAFEKMIEREVNIEVAALRILSITEVPLILDNPCLPLTCVKMRIKGRVAGDIFFIVPDEYKSKLLSLVKKAMLHPGTEVTDIDPSIILEIGNIIAGNFLSAIIDFCGLNIDYSVPELAMDMIQSLLDETLAILSGESQEVLLINNVFNIDKSSIETFFLIIPFREFVTKIIDSMEKIKRAYENEKC